MTSLLRQLGLDLNDIDQSGENTTWTKEKLVADVTDALSLISLSLPNAVGTEDIVVKLTPCQTQQNVADGRRIIYVIGVCDAHGRIIKAIPQTGGNVTSPWTRKKCRPSQFSSVESYSISSAGTLSVQPSPIAGVDTYLKVLVAKKFSEGDSVPAALVPIVKEWVLYKCLQVDDDGAEGAHVVAASHYKRFFELLQYMTNAKEAVNRE